MNPQPVDLAAYLARPGLVDPYLRWGLGRAAAPVVLDIGACEGEDSIRYGRLLPRARIFSFEPLPANQAIIRANLAKYGSGAELVPVALSDRAGTATFHVSGGPPPELFSGEQWNYGNKSSSLLPPKAAEKMYGWIDFPESITVTTETLDAFCAARGLGRIGFIHMDVQGAEALVLAGAEATLPRVGAVWLEVTARELYRGQPLAAAIEATMRRHGFAAALSEQREIEGDRLYLNLRRTRNLLWLAGRRLRGLLASGVRQLRKTPSPPMIITWLTGGLGNQMFQYAAGLALAEERRTTLKLDVSWFRLDPQYEAHNRYALSCFNVTEQFATREEIERAQGVQLTRTERWATRLARPLRLYRYANRHAGPSNFHYAQSFRFYPEFFAQPDPTYLHGMWQSEQFFAPIANLVRLHFSFRYPMQPKVAEMMRRIQGGGPSVAVHFRRGDYVRNATFAQDIGVVGFDYYERAMAILRERHPNLTFYVFSDDIDAIERDFRPPVPCTFVRATEPWHSYDKIRLMSACDHAIISNSTFAWWAAWLNPNPAKSVIAPDPWFAAGQQDGADVVPASWQRLPSRA